jgi:DNA-binding FrmR family transcriptional regulator
MPRHHKKGKDEIIQRLRRIQGQVKGLERMVDSDAHYGDVLTQLSAATAALQSCALVLIDEQLNGRIADAIADGGQKAEAMIAEAYEAIARLVRP